MKEALEKLRQLLLRLEDLLLGLVLAGMILLASSQILLRNLWEYSIPWGDPSLRLMVLWVTLLGAMAATRDHNHIRIDLLSRYLPPRLKQAAGRVTDLFAALVCALLAWHAARFVLFELEDGSRFLDLMPLWPLQLVMPAGFGIMALRLLLNAVSPQPRKAVT